jgi:micrococcal nuclease
MYEYNATLTRVVDGDTLIVRIDLGFKVEVEQVVRLIGINAPEVVGSSKDAGLAAKEAVEGILATCGGKVRLRSFKPSSRDKYGRYLAEVHCDVDGATLCLNTELVARGHATPYSV